jgi:hypothetical protein
MEIALAERIDLPLQMSDEEQRSLCFKLFNTFWNDAGNQGIPFDTVGTMAISAALFGLVAKHGTETTAEFLEDLARTVREGAFEMEQQTH